MKQCQKDSAEVFAKFYFKLSEASRMYTTLFVIQFFFSIAKRGLRRLCDFSLGGGGLMHRVRDGMKRFSKYRPRSN